MGDLTEAGKLIHRRVVQYGIEKLGYDLRSVARDDPRLLGGEGFCARRCKDPADPTALGDLVKHVYVGRRIGGLWASDDIEAFLAATEAPAKEAMIIAHELGHATQYSRMAVEDADAQDLEFESLHSRLLGNDGQVPLDRVAAYYGCEVEAWELGADIIGSLGFGEWWYFDQERARYLKSYAEGIQRALPGWRPPPVRPRG